MSNKTPTTRSSSRSTRRLALAARGAVSRHRSRRHEAAYEAAVDYSFGLMALRIR